MFGGKKIVMANEIIRFTYPKPLVILSKLRVKCVIGFGRFCENFRRPMELLERDHDFQCSAE